MTNNFSEKRKIITERLRQYEDFREDDTSMEYLTVLCLRDAGLQNISMKTERFEILKTDIVKFAEEIDNWRRMYEKVKEENPQWAGKRDKTKHDKSISEQNVMIDLGYSPGFQQDVKTLKELPMSKVNESNADKLHKEI